MLHVIGRIIGCTRRIRESVESQTCASERACADREPHNAHCSCLIGSPRPAPRRRRIRPSIVMGHRHVRTRDALHHPRRPHRVPPRPSVVALDRLVLHRTAVPKPQNRGTIRFDVEGLPAYVSDLKPVESPPSRAKYLTPADFGRTFSSVALSARAALHRDQSAVFGKTCGDASHDVSPKELVGVGLGKRRQLFDRFGTPRSGRGVRERACPVNTCGPFPPTGCSTSCSSGTSDSDTHEIRTAR